MPDVPASRYYHSVHVVLLTAIEAVSPSDTLLFYRNKWWTIH